MCYSPWLLKPVDLVSGSRDHSIRHGPFPICFFQTVFQLDAPFSYNTGQTDNRQTTDGRNTRA